MQLTVNIEGKTFKKTISEKTYREIREILEFINENSADTFIKKEQSGKKLYLMQFYDPETEEYFNYLVKTSAEESIVRGVHSKLQEKYNSLCMEFSDFDEVYGWLDKEISKYLQDAEPVNFIFI